MKTMLRNSRLKPMLIVSGILSAMALQAEYSGAQGLPPQTAAEKHLQRVCSKRSEAYLDNPLSYPIRVFAPPGIGSLAVNVDPKKWAARSDSERLAMMRDIACSYAGGRMLKSAWYTFSAVEFGTDRLIETYSGDKLWPASGRYK
jgi:hypothetical protein